MKGIILYFSGTGNTKFVSNKIEEEFIKNGCDVETHSIEEKLSLQNLTYDFLVLGFPKYFEYIPNNFIEYLNDNLKYSSKEIKTMIFSTGRDKMKIYFHDLEKTLIDKNYRVIITKNFQMPDSFTLSKNYKENSSKYIKDTFQNTIAEIKDIVSNFLIENTIKEEVSNIKGSIYKTIYKLKTKGLYKNSINFSINSKCDKCNLCVDICPTGNIEKIGQFIKFRDNCIMCCRCVNACPKNAILYKDKEHSQYKENIDLIVG